MTQVIINSQKESTKTDIDNAYLHKRTTINIITMNVYEIQTQGEKEWIAAENIIQALRYYESVTDIGLIHFDLHDDIVEIPKEKWNDYYIKFEDDPSIKDKTFASYVPYLMNPEIICSTAY